MLGKEAEGTEGPWDLLASPAQRRRMVVLRVTPRLSSGLHIPLKKMQLTFTCHYCQVIGVVHKYLCGAGEGSVVRALTALAEDPSYFLVPVLGGSEWYPCMYVCMYVCVNSLAVELKSWYDSICPLGNP